MNRVLRMVALCSVLFFTACAHEQQIKSENGSQGSLSWPLPPPENIGLERSFKPTPQHLTSTDVDPKPISIPKAKTLARGFESPLETPLIFDIPIAYNSRVKFWIEFFQTNGRG